MRVIRGALMSLVFSAGLLVPILANPAIACASGHDHVYLSDHTVGLPNATFYAGDEDGTALITIRPTPGCSDGDESIALSPTAALYQTEIGGTAEADDFQAIPETESPFLCVDQHGQNCGETSFSFPVSIASEGAIEPALETFFVRLTKGRKHGGTATSTLVSPSHMNPVPVHIVDTDGVARPALEPGAQGDFNTRLEGTQIQIPVFRAGSLEGVSFTVEGASPNPAVDSDFTCSPACTGGAGTLTAFPLAGERLGFVTINLLNDGAIETEEYLRLTVLGADAQSDAYTTVSIRDRSSDRAPPESRFHHPRKRLRYLQGDFRIREMHTYTKDEGLAGIDTNSVQIALRRKKLNGACELWNGRRFRSGQCAAKRWLKMTYEAAGDTPTEQFFIRRFPALKPSIGTNIKNYTAFTRARDLVGNWETLFESGRNNNTFEVKRQKQ